jgi:hypothetical protein
VQADCEKEQFDTKIADFDQKIGGWGVKKSEQEAGGEVSDDGGHAQRLGGETGDESDA